MNIKKISIGISCLFMLSTLRAQHDKYDLDVRLEPACMSPNNDGIQDNLFLYPVFSLISNVTKWRLTITTAKGKTVQRLEGTSLPALIKWDGKTKKGAIVAPGAYNAMLQVSGRGFNVVSHLQPFLVDNEVPVVTLAVSTAVLDQSVLNNQVLTFTPTVQDVSPIDRWQLQILDQTGRTVYVDWGTGTVRDITWDGKGKETKVLVPLGPYKAVFQAWDMAGNASEPASTDLQVNVSAREMLMAVLKIISVHETDIGLIVQLKRPPNFTFDEGKPVLTSAGEAAMREISILANAYSEAPVRLDGYSRIAKKAGKDRDVGSLYAWTVYSYLVKKGNVKASRIQVRGRGRSAMFNRRAAGVPILPDGVEVILEGSGNW
jgi:outer membrane protein OmpA-like peptidoglycan-associated protein